MSIKSWKIEEEQQHFDGAEGDEAELLEAMAAWLRDTRTAPSSIIIQEHFDDAKNNWYHSGTISYCSTYTDQNHYGKSSDSKNDNFIKELNNLLLKYGMFERESFNV